MHLMSGPIPSCFDSYDLVFNSLKMVLTVKVLVSQLCPTLCDPMDDSPPGQNTLSMGFSRQEY